MLTSPLPGQQWDARAIISQSVYGQRETSLVSSIFGPWYLDFGITGVAFGLALMAAILSRVEHTALQTRSSIALAAYAYGLVLYVLSVHSGLSDFGFAVMIPAAFIWTANAAGAESTIQIRA
jgi:oligosaccharide repeat unit polymerase